MANRLWESDKSLTLVRVTEITLGRLTEMVHWLLRWLKLLLPSDFFRRREHAIRPQIHVR